MQIWEAINELLSFINEDGIAKLSKELVDGKYDSFSSKLIAMRESLNDFDELQDHDKRKSRLNSKEREILRICTAKLLAETGWSDILEQELYLHWINCIEQKYPDLKGQPFETYLNNRDRLDNLLKKHQNIVIQKIINQINGSIMRPEITLNTNHSYKAQYSKWNTLLDELNKKRHVLPIRRLVDSYEDIILKIAPCWLATPSAVSSIFPLKRTLFDYIIFDEASQCSVEKSLTILDGGKKFVIVGDEKQLPPIKHFNIGEDEQETDEDTDRVLLSASLLSLA
jgi:hypothetical protein